MLVIEILSPTMHRTSHPDLFNIEMLSFGASEPDIL